MHNCQTQYCAGGDYSLLISSDIGRGSAAYPTPAGSARRLLRSRAERTTYPPLSTPPGGADIMETQL